MITVEVSRRFVREFEALPPHVRRAVERKVALLIRNPRHPSLRLKRIRSVEGYWEMSVTMNYRVVLAFVSENAVELLRVGPHRLLERP